MFLNGEEWKGRSQNWTLRGLQACGLILSYCSLNHSSFDMSKIDFVIQFDFRLTSERGLPALRNLFDNVRFKGKGHEVGRGYISQFRVAGSWFV